MPTVNAERIESVGSDPETESPRTEPLVSVIVPCCGQLEYTRLCVPNLLRHSRGPFELVFVDMGSLDGTAEYLMGIAAAATVPVCVVWAGAETGFTAAYGQGLARTRGEFVVFLSNETVVTENWLNHLVALAEMAPDIGIVGAMTNRVPSSQSVGPVPYVLALGRRMPPYNGTPSGELSHDLGPIHQFARQWREQNRGQWFEADYLEPFCLLIKRQVLVSVGSMADGPSSLFFDSSDLCRKVRQAGYRLTCCRDLFIHHFAGRPSSQPGEKRGQGKRRLKPDESCG